VKSKQGKQATHPKRNDRQQRNGGHQEFKKIEILNLKKRTFV